MTMRSDMPPELRTLLDQERAIPPLSAAQRARAVARARAALNAPVTSTNAQFGAPSRLRWASAAAAGLVVSAAIAAGAYELHARFAPGPMTRPAVVASVPHVVANAPASAPPAVAVPDLPPAPAVAAPGLPPADAAREELHLMRQARAAVARGDFTAALSPINEHTRRFKNGRLVEEREALRVRALVGLGRSQEARHAAAAFRTRFPRSVLLPAVSQMPAPGP